ncbi:MAG: hypothetical protein JNL80_00500 [Phycisphaerae bacterium]|nr:hypothetical protein [Phycisphaerae bacterium]
MHVLTKIFIVLVTLLALAIVPLVAVRSTNEGKYKELWMGEQSQAASANAKAAALESQKAALEASYTNQITELNGTIATLRRDGDLKGAELRKVQGELKSAATLQASINSNLEIMAQAGKQSATTNEALVKEVRDLREKVLASEKSVIELDEAVSTLQSQLEVADASRKALQEELQKVREEKVASESRVAKYIAMYGEIAGSVGVGIVDDSGRVPATRDLTATVQNVTTANDQVLVEINVGTRDGVQEGWTLVVSEGSSYVADIRIIKVDVNRSTGVASFVNAGRSVSVGQRAVAHRGQ